MKNPIKYCTGWKRLDNFLSAVAYGVSVLGAIIIAWLASWMLWFLWVR